MTMESFLSKLSSVSLHALLRAGLVLLVGYIAVRLVTNLVHRALGRTALTAPFAIC